MSHVLFSYYAAALLMNPNRKEGRAQARTLRDKAKGEAEELYRAVRLRYRGILALHYAGITWSRLVAIQHTPMYWLLFRAVS
jgi:hypothetical protein